MTYQKTLIRFLITYGKMTFWMNKIVQVKNVLIAKRVIILTIPILLLRQLKNIQKGKGTKMYFEELYKGKINSQQICKKIITEIENQLELYRDDGWEDTPNYEDLEFVLNLLLDVVNKSAKFPFQLDLHTSANDLYKDNIIENMEDIAFRNYFYGV